MSALSSGDGGWDLAPRPGPKLAASPDRRRDRRGWCGGTRRQRLAGRRRRRGWPPTLATTEPEVQGGGGGPAGCCICLRCGTKAAHEAGVRCLTTRCPHCGAAMVREGSEHHRAYLQRQTSKPCP